MLTFSPLNYASFPAQTDWDHKLTFKIFCSVSFFFFFLPLSLLFLYLTLGFWKVSWHFDIPLAWHLNSPACTWAKPAGDQCERASNWILTPVRAALGGWHRPTTSPPLCPPGLKWKHFALTLPSFPLCFLADWAIKVTYWQASAGAHLNTCSVKEAPLWFHILRIARPGQSMMRATVMPNNLKSFERKRKKDHSDSIAIIFHLNVGWNEFMGILNENIQYLCTSVVIQLTVKLYHKNFL